MECIYNEHRWPHQSKGLECNLVVGFLYCPMTDKPPQPSVRLLKNGIACIVVCGAPKSNGCSWTLTAALKVTSQWTAL